ATAAPPRQLPLSGLRAGEPGRPTIQISTVGVSGVITPDGDLTRTTELFTPDHFAATVPLRTSMTLANQLGDWPIILTTVGVVAMVILGVATGRRSRWDDAGGRRGEGGHDRSGAGSQLPAP